MTDKDGSGGSRRSGQIALAAWSGVTGGQYERADERQNQEGGFHGFSALEFQCSPTLTLNGVVPCAQFGCDYASLGHCGRRAADSAGRRGGTDRQTGDARVAKELPLPEPHVEDGHREERDEVEEHASDHW
jgi:hypothetical protein